MLHTEQKICHCLYGIVSHFALYLQRNFIFMAFSGWQNRESITCQITCNLRDIGMVLCISISIIYLFLYKYNMIQFRRKKKRKIKFVENNYLHHSKDVSFSYEKILQKNSIRKKK